MNVLVFHPAFFLGTKRAENLARLDRASRYAHPGISPVLGTGEIGPTRWVATLPVGGLPLTHWRRDKGAMPLAHTYRVMAQVLDALEHIHRAGGVHGGLSPETIRFHSDADRVLLAQPWWLDATDVPLDELKPLRTSWLAPELVYGEPAEAAATDIYGLGLVLGYVLACGLTEPGHSLLVQGIDVPPSIDDIYVVATSRQPEHRFADVASFRAALELAAGIEWREAQVHVARLEGTSAGPSTRRSLKVEVLEVEEFDPAEAQTSRETKGSQRLTPDLLMAPSLPPKDIESTSEDIAFPAAEQAKAFRPATDFSSDTNDRTDTAMPAFLLDDDDVVVTSVSTLPPEEKPFPSTETSGPVTGRSQRRVVAQTLPHGHQRAASALIPVLDTPERAAIASTSVIDVDLGSPPPVVPTIALRTEPVTVPDTLIRVANRPQAPTPKGGDVEATLVSQAATSLPPALPPAATGSRARPVAAPPPAMPTLPGANSSPSDFDPFSSSLEVLELGPAHAASVAALPLPPALPPHSDEPADPDAPDAGDTSDSGELDIIGESTIVEGIAPALLDSIDIETLGPAKKAEAQPDPFALPVVHFEADSVFAVPGATMRPPPPPTGLLPEDQEDALATLISSRVPSREAARPPRTESLPSGPLMPVVSATPPTFVDEPRTLRDASSALAGAQLVATSGPRKAPGPVAPAAASSLSLGSANDIPLHGGDRSRIPIAEEKTNWTLWAALAALVIGGIIAFFVFSSGDDKPGDPGQVAVSPGETGGNLAGALPDATSGADAVLVAAGADVGGVAGESDAVQPDAGPSLDASSEVLAVAIADAAESPDVSVGAVAETSIDTSAAVAAVDMVDVVEPADTNAASATTADATPEVVAVATADVTAPEVGNTIEPLPEIISDPNTLRCPDGMLKLKRKIQVDGPNATKLDSWEVACIDRFEYPGAGASPSVGLDLPGARAACAGRGKRLCTRSEWRRACGGTYPYGKEYDPERCNTAGADGAPKSLVAAGSKKGCMSPSGAFDMVGNAAEWTSDGFINGGTSLRNSDDATCNLGSRRAGGAPHVGFRCCVDAK
jgi:serine/threonine protein kinase